MALDASVAGLYKGQIAGDFDTTLEDAIELIVGQMNQVAQQIGANDVFFRTERM